MVHNDNLSIYIQNADFKLCHLSKKKAVQNYMGLCKKKSECPSLAK